VLEMDLDYVPFGYPYAQVHRPLWRINRLPDRPKYNFELCHLWRLRVCQPRKAVRECVPQLLGTIRTLVGVRLLRSYSKTK
jgi:hypothetical protein